MSVKLFDKAFSDDEITRLKTINGESDVTTYEIFLTLDALTRACEHRIHTSGDDEYYSSHSKDKNSEWSGAEFIKTPTSYDIWTSWRGFDHGWVGQFTEDETVMSETRRSEYKGFLTEIKSGF